MKTMLFTMFFNIYLPMAPLITLVCFIFQYFSYKVSNYILVLTGEILFPSAGFRRRAERLDEQYPGSERLLLRDHYLHNPDFQGKQQLLDHLHGCHCVHQHGSSQ
jgi:hypothetical protein